LQFKAQRIRKELQAARTGILTIAGLLKDLVYVDSEERKLKPRMDAAKVMSELETKDNEVKERLGGVA